jgi:hypothetical protein
VNWHAGLLPVLLIGAPAITFVPGILCVWLSMSILRRRELIARRKEVRGDYPDLEQGWGKGILDDPDVIRDLLRWHRAPGDQPVW